MVDQPAPDAAPLAAGFEVGTVPMPPAEAPQATQAPEPSETSARFLEPMGTVKLAGGEQATEATETSQRFRRSVLSQDKSRPAWERKYVD